MAFHPFPRLPPELQTQVWETCIAGSCMHVVDVYFPTRTRAFGRRLGDEVDVQHRMRLEQYKNTIFLDYLDEGAIDPSMYHYVQSLRQTDRLAMWAAGTKEARNGSTTVYFPGRGAKVTIPSSDVLMLRFRDTNHNGFAEADSMPSCIGLILRSQWSAELSSTLETAKKIALNVVESWIFSPLDTLGWEEMTHFASTLYKDLEVLYLVDTCAGRCGDCRKKDLKAGDLQRRGTLWKRLDKDGKLGDEERPGDVIRAIGKRYVEVFDLEALGWNECHPAYGFAFLIGNAIRFHQNHVGKKNFQGIRVLVVEDE